MGEIKSAIELAMERTKNLVMDEEEKRAFARKDVEDRLRAVMRRFLEGMIDGDAFLNEYRRTRAEKTEKRALLVDLLIEEFDASVGSERVFDLLELVGEDAGRELGREAAVMRDRYREEMGNRATGIKESILGRLQGMGISGSAVEPNVTEWEEWREAARETGDRFKRHLHEWTERVRALTV